MFLPTQSVLIATATGIIPILVWLWFWLKEDRRNPEPRRLILLAFFAGIVTVPLVIFPQKLLLGYLAGSLLVVSWAAIEELFKLVVAYFAVLRRCENDEPIDVVIYLIIVALGFSAAENALYLLQPLAAGDLVGGFLTTNLRFFGATLVHVLSSATIGVFIAFAFYKSRSAKLLSAGFGLILAIILHGAFNFFIINSSGEDVFLTFFGVWIGIIVLLLLLERVKRIRTR